MITLAKIKKVFRVTVDFLDGIGRRQIWTYTAAATFYLFLSLAPMLCLICALLPYTPLTEEYLVGVLHRVGPGELQSLMTGIVGSIYNSSAATLSISAVAVVWTASLSMLSLMRGMDAAHDKERKENFILFRLRAMFFMIIAVAAILLTLCAIVYGGQIIDLVRSKLESSWAVDALLTIIRILRFPIMMLFLFLTFLIMYKWMPFGRRKLLRQWPGALFCTVAWIVFSYIFSLYVENTDKYNIYGILGTVIVALLWMYYILFILLVGSYINKFVREEPAKLRALEESKNAELSAVEAADKPAEKPVDKPNELPPEPDGDKGETA